MHLLDKIKEKLQPFTHFALSRSPVAAAKENKVSVKSLQRQWLIMW